MAARTRNLFPLGIAVGPAHCNRVTERRHLRENVEGNTHTWLWARRRQKKSRPQRALQAVFRKPGPAALPALQEDGAGANAVPDYTQHLQAAASARCGQHIDDDLVEQILSLSNRPSY